MGDATRTSAFFQSKKRSRKDTEPEANNNTLSSGETTTSSTSLTIPPLQINSLSVNEIDLSETTSTDTVISNPAAVTSENNNATFGADEREKESLAFRLDKLNDKKCRYDSHEKFLKKCLKKITWCPMD